MGYIGSYTWLAFKARPYLETIKDAYYHNSPHLHTFAQRCKDRTLTVKKRDAVAATIPRTSCTCFQKFVKLKADSLFYKVCRLQDRLCFLAQ